MPDVDYKAASTSPATCTACESHSLHIIPFSSTTVLTSLLLLLLVVVVVVVVVQTLKTDAVVVPDQENLKGEGVHMYGRSTHDRPSVCTTWLLSTLAHTHTGSSHAKPLLSQLQILKRFSCSFVKLHSVRPPLLSTWQTPASPSEAVHTLHNQQHPCHACCRRQPLCQPTHVFQELCLGVV
jgi:hypothetical protein